MASSEINIDGIGTVKLFRRKGLKYIRITIGHDGSIRLSLPWYVPKKAGLQYVLSKRDWIEKHRNIRKYSWNDGVRLTPNYILKIFDTTQARTHTAKISGEFQIHIPSDINDEMRQKIIDEHVGELIRSEAKDILPERLLALAEKFDYGVKNIRIRKLKSRWGSCSSDKSISLNMMLVHVPKELCDYVLVHELAHTKHLNHGEKFWEEVSSKIPDYKERRKALRKFNPAGIL